MHRRENTSQVVKMMDMEQSPTSSEPDSNEEAKFDAPSSPPTPPAALQPEDEEEPDQIAALRSSWEFAAAIQLIRILGPVLKLRVFSSSVLEQALLAPGEFKIFLAELLYKLLRKDTNAAYADTDAEAWGALLRTKLNRQWSECFSSNPLARRGYMDVSPMTRVGEPGQQQITICYGPAMQCTILSKPDLGSLILCR